ncbi:MAG: hypothetical protein ACRECY_07695, partial [Phyllobacterium sp.]
MVSMTVRAFSLSALVFLAACDGGSESSATKTPPADSAGTFSTPGATDGDAAAQRLAEAAARLAKSEAAKTAAIAKAATLTVELDAARTKGLADAAAARTAGAAAAQRLAVAEK